jgi:hypothetical protein
MKKSKVLLPVLLSITLMTACEDKVENCTDDFVTSYNSVKSSYLSAYSPTSGPEEKANLVNDLQFFLNSHEETKCKLEGKEVQPGAEMKTLLSEVNSKMMTFEKAIPKVIYGDDDRIDVPDSTNEMLNKLAASTAAMIKASDIAADGTLPTETLGESFNLCPGEKFAEQINPAVCSGFLVRPDVLVTAGHCVRTQADCENYKWTFGFYNGVTKLKESQLYSCTSIIKTVVNSKTNGNGADFAVLKLDRKVAGRRPLAFRQSGEASKGAPLVVIGHPSGLPTKIAGGANVRSVESGYFVANLDTFGGNSGSAVFNATTGDVEGILVRGELDYVSDTVDGKVCKRVNKCSNSGCDGEDVTKITVVEGIPASKIPTFADVKKNVFDGVYDLTAMGGALKYNAFELDGSVIGGKKFLDLCGLQSALSSDKSDWTADALGECDKLELESVYNAFIDQML